MESKKKMEPNDIKFLPSIAHLRLTTVALKAHRKHI